MDSRLDKQRFFENNNASFMIPKKFEYTPARRDETETIMQKSVIDELEGKAEKSLNCIIHKLNSAKPSQFDELFSNRKFT